MNPVSLHTARLVLDQPSVDDADRITEYCQDPVFEHYMTTPWPYERADALGFVEDYVPRGWSNESEYNWAVRADGNLVGMIGYRTQRGDVGFWVGGPHRNRGYMTESVDAVVTWLFSLGVPRIEWFCVAGNQASAAVARKSGFVYTGERPSSVVHRDRGDFLAWHGVLSADDSREPKPGWPTD
jgi:RimJ/RimL family protein N-acetyltransferase